MIENGAKEHATVFKALSELKAHSLTDIYVNDSLQLATIRSMYPTVKVTAVENSTAGILGKTATQALLDNLINDTDLKSIKIEEVEISTITSH